MKAKLGAPLLFILFLGHVRSIEFKVVKFAETDIKTNKKSVGAMISLGEATDASFSPSNKEMKAGFGCLLAETRYKISFQVPEGKTLEPSLNFGVDSEDVKKVDELKRDFVWENGNEVCIVFGTWWPAASNNNIKFEIYIRLLTDTPVIKPREVFFLSAVSKGPILDSSLYLNKDKKSLKITEIGGSLDETKKNETKEMISKFDKSSQTIIGNIKCPISADSQFRITLGLGFGSATPQGDGEFVMVFPTDQIALKDEKDAAEEFAKLGTTDAVKTQWANLKCDANGIDLKSNFGLSQLEETEKQGNKAYYIV